MPCPRVFFQVTLSGSLRNTNLREMNDLGDVQSVSFARQGSPMLVLTAGMIVEALCQDIKPASPVLPPETTRIPGPQSWFSLFTYRFCGAWQYEGVEGPAFMDMSVNPIKRYGCIMFAECLVGQRGLRATGLMAPCSVEAI